MAIEKHLIKTAAIISLGIFCIYAVSDAQTNVNALTKLTALVDDFINDIKSFEHHPSLSSPELVLDNPLTFGNYDDFANVLHTTEDWLTLPQRLKDFFAQAVKRADSTLTPESLFEKVTHQWIFIHELGHWWRACQKQKASHYDQEMGANRIAVAYWREKDPAFMNWQLKVFEHFVKGFPNPVPNGVSKERYLNENYNTIGGTRVYTWFQAEMVIEAYYEKPTMTFRIAIDNAGNQFR